MTKKVWMRVQGVPEVLVGSFEVDDSPLRPLADLLRSVADHIDQGAVPGTVAVTMPLDSPNARIALGLDPDEGK